MELNHAKKLALELMEKHKLSNWKFEFDTAKRRFGSCQHRAMKITLSKALTVLNSEAHMRDTILHEIAHALVPRQRHNEVWRKVALSIGCNGQACYGHEVIQPKRKLKGTCPECKRTILRDKANPIACGVCCKGKYNAAYKFVFTPNE